MNRVLLAGLLVLAVSGCAQFRTCGPSGCPSPPAARQPAFDLAQFRAANGLAPFDATCRLQIRDRDGSTSWGSGALVEWLDDGRGLVVTNEHVVRDRAGDAAGQAIFRGGQPSPLRVLAADAIWDVAIVEVQPPANIAAAKLAEPGQTLRIGETLAICGFGDDGVLRGQTGVLTEPKAPRVGMPAELLDVRPCSARMGDSGGPIFNSRGFLVGCLWGADGRRTLGAPFPRIRALLDSVRARQGIPLRRPAFGPGDPGGRPPANREAPAAGQTSDPEAANLRARIRALERELAAKAEAAARPAIAAAGNEIKREAARSIETAADQAIEQQAAAAAPGLMAKLLPLAVTGLSGFGFPVAGTTAALWLAGKLGSRLWTSFRNRRKLGQAKRRMRDLAAQAQQVIPGLNEFTPPAASPLESQSISAAPSVVVDRQVQTKTEYVRVPTVDPEGESYREMMRRMAQLTPGLAPYFEQLESGKRNLMHGQQVSGRLTPAAVAPADAAQAIQPPPSSEDS